MCTFVHCDIDGFAKMPLRASIFASWYNNVRVIREHIYVITRGCNKIAIMVYYMHHILLTDVYKFIR